MNVAFENLQFDSSAGHPQSFKGPKPSPSAQHGLMAAALLAGDAAARARAHLALSAGASLEEAEEARQLADSQKEQVSWRWEALGYLRIQVVNIIYVYLC